MACDHDHPELAPLPMCTSLGPDPEPLDSERRGRITHSAAPRIAPRRRTEAAGGTRPGDPLALPLHTLATPGPGD